MQKASNRLPTHVAIIMDGNGRWARQRNLPRLRGHEEAVNSVRDIVEECGRQRIKHLTLYALSSENFARRPRREIAFLMGLLKRYLATEREDLKKKRVRLTAIGRIEELPKDVQAELRKTEEATKGNPGLHLCLAINYGGRNEIVDATRQLAREVAAGRLRVEEIDDKRFREHLYEPDTPYPDLIIRTAGEMRLSNFLLWQCSYAELCVMDVYWPDFRRQHLRAALSEYAGRERRFGAL